jgi:hypothetical protein
MSRASIIVLVLFACSALAGEKEALLARLDIAGLQPDGVGVYSRYKDGRPRLVVAARYFDFSTGEVLLVRLPDRDAAKGKVIDRYDPEAGAMAVSFWPLIDRKDVVIQVAAKHSEEGRVLRVVHDKFEEIAQAFAGPQNTPDLDGDGVPEIVWSGYMGPTECGPRVSGGVLRWDGDYYAGDGRQYVVVQRATVGWAGQYEFVIPDTPVTPAPRQYILHLHRLRGAKTARVLIDEENVAPETPITLENGSALDCGACPRAASWLSPLWPPSSSCASSRVCSA